VAIVPPDEVLDAIAGVIAALDGRVPGVRWTRREQWHLTLQFLGNRVDLDASASALAGIVPRTASVQLGGLGAFSSPRRARVVWIGVVDGLPWLQGLAAEVAALLAPTGFVPEAREYHPHMTLARLARPGDLREPVATAAHQAATVGRAWSPGEVVLFQSTTRREGATYRAHARVPLLRGGA
jgi:2'-5' RNA ligase